MIVVDEIWKVTHECSYKSMTRLPMCKRVHKQSRVSHNLLHWDPKSLTPGDTKYIFERGFHQKQPGKM